MGLRSKFKAALIGGGLLVSAAGGLIFNQGFRAAKGPQSQEVLTGISCQHAITSGNACSTEGYKDAFVEKDLEFTCATGTTFFFAGATLLAAGLRRRKVGR
jgi:hypothetical protein